MRLKQIELENFRSAVKEQISFGDGVNLLYGSNAAGKTNVLEAIYFFARGRSFRGGRDADLTRFGEKGFSLGIEYEKNTRIETLGYRYYDGARQRTHNGVKIGVKEAIGSFCAVLFCPDHLAIIKRTPAERREFLNVALSQLSGEYIAALTKHKKLLENRNALLKSEEAFDPSLMESYNEEFAAVNAKLCVMRREYVARLEESMVKTVADISGGRESVKLFYKSDIPAELSRENEIKQRYERLLSESLTREQAAKMTLYGIQRDDLEFFVNEKEARQFASQGQQRSIALALKIGEGEILSAEKGEEPVYLLDDVLGELDEDRKAYILSRTGGRQFIVTACEKSDYDSLIGVKKIRVEKGRYYEEN